MLTTVLREIRGNELELLQFKPTEMVPKGCPERIWKGGYFYKTPGRQFLSLYT